jgi:hypothetical protein
MDRLHHTVAVALLAAFLAQAAADQQYNLSFQTLFQEELCQVVI